MKTKNITLIGSLLFIALAAASCAGGDGNDSTVTAQGTAGDDTAAVTEAVTEEPSVFELLPAADFGGEDFMILINGQKDTQGDIMTEEEETGDLLHDIVYQRNRAVEEKYNVNIVGDSLDYEEVKDTIRLQVQGGTNDYDLYFSHSSVSSLASSGYLYPINQLPHVDLTQEWWDQDAVEDLSVAEQVFMVTGDISPTSYLSSSCLVFNKKLFSNNDMEYPYALAADGKWTIDAFLDMTKGLTQDINGDGAYDYDKDLFSLTSWGWDSPYSLFYGAGGYLSGKGEDDIPYVNFDIEKLTSIYDRIYELVIGQNSNFVTDINEYTNTYACFLNGNAYFCDATLFKIGLFFRDMEDDFGILPMPKLDEESDYTSLVNLSAPLIVVPRNCDDTERTGLMLEALATGAYDMITPSLFEVVTKSKYARDEESADMVDLIIRNRVFDPVYIYQFPGYGCVDGQLKAKSREIASKYESNLKSATKQMEKLIEAYQDME
ncbi:MAG: extracellular solute-binding protein [Clostridia bacterium]|nr:extracellular solute-binding protein [Clostridia bacterium]